MSAPDPASAGPEPCRKCGHHRGTSPAEKGCECGCGCTPSPPREPEGEAVGFVARLEALPASLGSGLWRAMAEDMVSRLLREAKIAALEGVLKGMAWSADRDVVHCALAELRERKG